MRQAMSAIIQSSIADVLSSCDLFPIYDLRLLTPNINDYAGACHDTL